MRKIYDSLSWFIHDNHGAFDGAVIMSIGVSMLILLTLAGLEVCELILDFFAGVR